MDWVREKKWFVIRSFLIELALFLVLAAGIAQAQPVKPIPPKEVAARMKELQHSPWRGEVEEHSVDGSLGGCSKLSVSIGVTDPVTGVRSFKELTVVLPDGHLPAPAMIVVPTIKGETMIEREFATRFCVMNVASIIADVSDNSTPEGVPPWGMEDKRTRDAILALRTVIDYAKSSPHFVSHKIGMLGSSLGGILTAFMAGLEGNRLAAIVTVVAGGNMPYILANSDNAEVAELRERRMAQEQMKSVDEYEEKLREVLRYDPTYFAPFVHADRVLMVMADSDTKVPSETQIELHKAFGKPAESIFSGGHADTIFRLAFNSFDVVDDFLGTTLLGGI